MRPGLSVAIGLVLIVSSAMLSSVASANDSAVTGVGGSFQPMKGEHPHVRMVRETIHITAGKDFYDTIADFEFQNSGPASTVPMGFPESGGGDMRAELYKNKSAFKRFRSWIDGKPVAVRRVNPAKVSEMQYDALWVKRVPFARGQRRRVRVSYRSELGMAAGLGLERLVSYDFTGGNWRQDVKESVLSVTLREPGYYLVGANLGNTFIPLKREGTTFTMRRTNWQAQTSFVMRILSTLPGWLNPPDNVMFDEAERHFTGVNVPGRLAHPDRREVGWLPPGLLRNGKVFVSLDYLRSHLRDKIDSKRAGRGDREVKVNWLAATRVIELRAGRFTLHFQPGKSSMTVYNRRTGKTSVAPLGQPLLQQPSEVSSSSPVTYLPLAPVTKALNGTASYDKARRQFKINVPDFT